MSINHFRRAHRCRWSIATVLTAIILLTTGSAAAEPPGRGQDKRGVIEGAVTELDGSPASSSRVDLFILNNNRQDLLASTTTESAGGTFSFSVRKGCYAVVFVAPPGRSFPAGPTSRVDTCVTSNSQVVSGINATLESPVGQDDGFAGLPFDGGQVVAADYALTPEAIGVWNYVTNGFHLGLESYDSSTDTQVTHQTSGGDPLPTLGGQTYQGYRTLTTDGPQSLWDAANQDDHTRSQLGGWGPGSSLHLSGEGDREFIVYSVRLSADTPIPGSVLSHTGVRWLSMVSQFKSTLPSGNAPAISVYEGRDGLQLRVRENNGSHYVNIDDVPRGVWLRIGIDVHWSTGNDGAYRWWGDLDGDTTIEFKPLSDLRRTATILPGSEAAAFNIGPYHHVETIPTHGRDYANVEILSHSATDSWGTP